ncbi:MAG: universal stress protein [Bacteroidota bacterium]
MLPFQTILCALDFEPGSARALVQAADLAARARADLHLLHVSPRGQKEDRTDDGSSEAAFGRRVAAFVNEALDRADAFDALGPHVHRVQGASPVAGILGYARDIGADLVVVGTHGRRGLGHVLLGSVAGGTLRRSPVPVLVVPEQATGPGADAPVVIAADVSDLSAPAARLGADLAEAVGAPLLLAHARAVPADHLVGISGHPVPEAPSSRTESHDALDALAREAEIGAPYERHVIPGEPRHVLVDLAARTRARTLVVGTRGRGRFAGLGSVAEWVVRHAPCPVLVVPAAASGSAASTARVA